MEADSRLHLLLRPSGVGISKEPRFHPLAATLVNEPLGGAGGIKGDKSWKAALERFRAAQALEPTGLGNWSSASSSIICPSCAGNWKDGISILG